MEFWADSSFLFFSTCLHGFQLKSIVIQITVLLYVICQFFSLAAFKCFVFSFQQFDFDVSEWGFHWVYPVWDSLSFLESASLSFAKFRVVVNPRFFNIFSAPCFLISFWESEDKNITFWYCPLHPWGSVFSFFFLPLFYSLCCSNWVISSDVFQFIAFFLCHLQSIKPIHEF